jgi:Ser/Thr protein kinase RdoA (MazF antagonist)
MPVTLEVPNLAIAGDLASAAVGSTPTEVRRFGTGLHHYVFEAMFADRPPVVVRIAAKHSRSAMVGALKLSHLLRPKGVPLPAIIHDGLNHHFCHLVLERLPGTDLGDVMRELSDSRLEAVATKVAKAQRIVATTASGTRYGYGAEPADPPWQRWSQVLEANLTRSRQRIAGTGLFGTDAVDIVANMVSAARAELDALPPVPFLHDTTTKNVIVTREGIFSGIVDVDDLCFGDPRYAVALTLASLTAAGVPTQYVDAWLRLAGYQNDRIFRLYVILFIVDFMSERGQAFNHNPQPSAATSRKQLLGVFASYLQFFQP